MARVRRVQVRFPGVDGGIILPSLGLPKALSGIQIQGVAGAVPSAQRVSGCLLAQNFGVSVRLLRNRQGGKPGLIGGATNCTWIGLVFSFLEGVFAVGLSRFSTDGDRLLTEDL